jgi:competence protein ComEC
MAVVAGVIFFIFRAGLALIPGLAERAPIKKWAAFAALIVTGFYLLLSGNQVATQRSFIMIAVVLVGVLLDRPTVTMRTLTVAALLVLFFAPEAVVHPSFQMSFAATLALIVGYSNGAIKVRAGADSSIGARAALWGVNEIVGLTIASLLAGLATTPYAAYHFHRIAPYGVLANLLAMPVVSAWVMPMGILGVLTMPFGFDAACWRQMGYGIEWMDAVALWVSSLPGAFGRVTSFGTGPLLLATASLLVMGLLKTPLRWSGVVLGLLAVLWAARVPVPDVLVADDGRSFAVRGADGRLAFHHTGGDTFATREWLAADADGRDLHDRGLGQGITCDASGCIGKLADGALVAYVQAPDAFEEDCRRAALVLATREAPPDCAATVIGRQLLRERGALALHRSGSGFAIVSARPVNFDRPWSPAPPRRVRADSAPNSSADATTSAPSRSAPRDATPQPDDVEADQ